VRWLETKDHYHCGVVLEMVENRGGARGVPEGALPPKSLPGPPSGSLKIFRVVSCHCIEVLHRPLTAPLVANLAPPVAPQMKMSGSAPG